MTLKITSDGFFTELVRKNKQGESVYPHEAIVHGNPTKGIKITLTSDNKDYHIVSLEKFIQHIADGDFHKVGRVRMKPLKGGTSNGFAVRTATMSKALIDEIERIKHI